MFNWLQPMVEGAHCLDLFAGSGALGFEALSRGAAFVQFIDTNAECVAQLQQNATMLQTRACDIQCMSAPDWLEKTGACFDLIFIDPPFQQNLIPASLDILLHRRCLKENGRLYIESEPGLKLPDGLQMLKQKVTGGVQYGLYSRQP